MAEFCTTCADRFHELVDINIDTIISRLKDGHTQPVLCEGCGLVALQKDDEGIVYKGYRKGQTVRWVRYLPHSI